MALMPAKGGLTHWTNERLQRLYERYNLRFFDARVRGYTVRVCKLRTASLGECHRAKRTIRIDVWKHARDRDVRCTLLHELAHAAVRSWDLRNGGHGYAFWKVLEQLLRQHAPISIGCPEANGHFIFSQAIPPEFPLCRRRMESVNRRARRGSEEKVRTHSMALLPDVLARIRMYPDRPWPAARLILSRFFPLIDLRGKPLNPVAASLLRQAKRAHEEEQRRFLAAKMQVIEAAKTMSLKKVLGTPGSTMAATEVAYGGPLPSYLADKLQRVFWKARREHFRQYPSPKRIRRLRRELGTLAIDTGEN